MAQSTSLIKRMPGGFKIEMDVKGTFDVSRDLDDGDLDLQSIVLSSGEIINHLYITNDINAILNSNGGGTELFFGSTVYAIKVDDKSYIVMGIVLPVEPDRVYVMDKITWGPRIWASLPMFLFTLAVKICSIGIMSQPFAISMFSKKSKKIVNYIQKTETDKNLVYLNAV